MHNTAIAALGLDCAYVAFHVRPDELGQAIEGMRALQIAGLNVTVPHKQGVMAHLDEVSAEAVSTAQLIRWSIAGPARWGYNTDTRLAYFESLKRDGGVERLPAQVALLGAGGAARSDSVHCYEREEVEQILLLNRTCVQRPSRGRGDLIRRTGCRGRA